MSLLITVEKVYFMDGIYRVTGQTEKPLNPDVNAYVTHLTIEIVKPTRAPLTHRLRDLLLDKSCKTIANEYYLATSQVLDYRGGYQYRITDIIIYSDYREAIEGVGGVYLTD